VAESSHDLEAILSKLGPEKRARFQAYNRVVSSFNTPSQSLFVLDNDNEVDTFQRDFNQYLVDTGRMDEGTRELPYHIIRIGYDGDMLDDMFRLTVSDEAEHFKVAQLDASMLYSKQAIFQHLYQTISKNKFLIFHVTEFPLAVLVGREDPLGRLVAHLNIVNTRCNDSLIHLAREFIRERVVCHQPAVANGAIQDFEFRAVCDPAV